MVAARGDRARRARPRGRARHLLRRPVPRRARLGLHRRPLHRRAQRLRASSRRPTTRPTPDYDGRVSVPVLWDKEDGRIVSNESADIVRIFNEWAGGDLYPAELRAEIDALNEWIYSEFQNGVYRAGFARSQEAYDEAFRGVFAALERLEAHLQDRRYLAGDAITEADWRLLPTLLRFDAVYHTHFRCNGKRLIEYPNLLALHDRPLPASRTSPQTFALDEIKRHYYTTHDELNPKRIIPAGRSTSGFTSA